MMRHIKKKPGVQKRRFGKRTFKDFITVRNKTELRKETKDLHWRGFKVRSVRRSDGRYQIFTNK